ncbi:phosphatidate cytidylyltransferase [Trujillonella humicola]|uniref:phosphatidate cytidylyltransferase n=1 Tax=Trujillonella humicola TaxID=3383699 RepID=UPI0039064F9E
MRRESDTGPLPPVRRPGPAAPPPTAPPTAEIAAPEGTREVPVPAVTGPATDAVPLQGALPSLDEGASVADEPAEELPVTEQPPEKPSRAGRDLVAAVGVGLSLGALILVSLLVYRPAFLLVLGAAVLVSVVELTRALRAGGAEPPLVPVLVGAVAMVALAWTRGEVGLVVAFLLTVLAVLLWRLGDGPEGYLRDAASGVLVALYVPLLAGFAVLLLVPDDGATRVILFIATVVGNDVGGYAAGVLFGRHPMAPTVSPKKSWEGMAGSVLGCVAVATPIVVLGLDGPWWGGVLFGAALAVSATLGDLGESLIKRDLGIKDMGTLLPGHGGLMDRMDSLLPSAAVAWLLLSWAVPA